MGDPRAACPPRSPYGRQERGESSRPATCSRRSRKGEVGRLVVARGWAGLVCRVTRGCVGKRHHAGATRTERSEPSSCNMSPPSPARQGGGGSPQAPLAGRRRGGGLRSPPWTHGSTRNSRRTSRLHGVQRRGATLHGPLARGTDARCSAAHPSCTGYRREVQACIPLLLGVQTRGATLHHPLARGTDARCKPAPPSCTPYGLGARGSTSRLRRTPRGVQGFTPKSAPPPLTESQSPPRRCRRGLRCRPRR